MKNIKQIEAEINRQLDKLDKLATQKLDTHKREIQKLSILAYINGMGFVLDKKERLSISDKTRERLLRATKEFRNGQDS